MRPTLAYRRLVEESTDPGLLRDADDRDRALGVLREASGAHPLWSRLAADEIADLWTGDIPLLSSRLDGTDIWTSTGRSLPGLLDQAGLSCAVEKIAAMSELDRRDQEWIISASMATLRLPYAHGAAAPFPGQVTSTAAEADRLITTACGLADQILARAAGTPDGNRANWPGLQLVEDVQWMVLPMGAGLGDGYLGVALFLAQLAELTGVGRYAETARRAVGALPGLLDAVAGRPELAAAVGCGGMSGLGGISYGMARLSGLLGDTELGRWAITAAELAGAVMACDASPGWTAGSAGFLAAMLAVHAETGSQVAAGLARRCADRLCDLVQRTGGRCVPQDITSPPGFAAGQGALPGR